jgi:hypothetical protein
MQIINIFPKTRFFTISFNQANDVNVKIYETGQLCFMFESKTNIHVYFGNVLGVAFLIPSGSLSLLKYPVYKNLKNCLYLQLVLEL